MPKYLYHYSTMFNETLQTPLRSGLATEAEIIESTTQYSRFNQVARTVDQIQFFFKPIESKMISEFFGEDHPLWFIGNGLFEYAVNIDNIGSCSFQCQSTEFQREFTKQYEYDNQLKKNDPNYIKRLHLLIRQARELNGEIGYTKKNLAKIHERYQYQLYELASKPRPKDERVSFAEYFNDIPHVMVYPKSGEICYSSVSSFMVGVDTRRLIT